MKIISPEKQYWILSRKHTGPKDKFVTLWRPDNKGYCYPIELAGIYDGYENGYHHDEENHPINRNDLQQRFIVKDDMGRDCIKNSRSFWNFVDKKVIPQLQEIEFSN